MYAEYIIGNRLASTQSKIMELECKEGGLTQYDFFALEQLKAVEKELKEIQELIEANNNWLNKTKYIKEQIKYGANEQVAGFIYNVLSHNGKGYEECIRSFFRAGYCYYFANMLKIAFKRGEVCWAAPFGHFVWCDDDGTPYDVEGIYDGEAEYFIPESYLGDAVEDFLHIPDVDHGTSKEEIQEIIERFKADNDK